MVINEKVKRGWYGQSLKHAKVGQIGGNKTALRGTAYFQKIGRLGGMKSAKVRARHV